MNALARFLARAAWLALLTSCCLASLRARAESAASRPLSPIAMTASADGRTIYIACATGDRVQVFDTASRQVIRFIATPPNPTGVALSPDGKNLAITCGAVESPVLLVDTASGRTTTKLQAGHTATAPVWSPDGRTLFVCNRFNDNVSEFNLSTRQEVRRIAVRREPVAAALTRDGRHLLVANLLHTGRADADEVAAVVSVIEAGSGRVTKELKLPNGSGTLNDIRVSPDGKYAVVTHILSRFYLPTTQLDRGWMNTNAGSLIDLERLELLNTVLLDTVDRGAANPWGAAWSADSKTLVIAHAGTHELSVIDFPALLAKLAAVGAPPAAGAAQPAYRAPASRTPADVPNDLSFLVGVRERRRLPEGDLGPRAVVIVGAAAWAANYFSDTVSLLPLQGTAPTVQSIALGPRPQMNAMRRGELHFHDARLCFQGWQSCATCHPGDARVDALNWDLLNDGLGNPKNNKSLLYTHRTPPAMSIGVRESGEAAVRAGIQHILFTVQPPEIADDMDAYLKALKPVPSPSLVHGKLSAAAQRGRKIFQSKESGCAQCHPAPLFTNLKSYDVGTAGPVDKRGEAFDTPTLVELWRTAPYLHDGSAATLKEVLTTRNAGQEHGQTSHLTPAQIDDLVLYLLSL